MNSLKNLAMKMIKIMQDVEYIQKTGFNSFHKYKYATDSDVAAAFSKAMRKHNVFMFSSILERSCDRYMTRGNKETFLITVKLEVTFVDADSGEQFTGTYFGDGSDSDDKGVYKAMTGAQKYALMKTFLVETGDDPERDNTNDNFDNYIDFIKSSNSLDLLKKNYAQAYSIYKNQPSKLKKLNAAKDERKVFLKGSK